jgi:hypothetical protein
MMAGDVMTCSICGGRGWVLGERDMPTDCECRKAEEANRKRVIESHDYD